MKGCFSKSSTLLERPSHSIVNLSSYLLFPGNQGTRTPSIPLQRKHKTSPEMNKMERRQGRGKDLWVSRNGTAISLSRHLDIPARNSRSMTRPIARQQSRC